MNSERFSRTRLLLGAESMEKLRHAHVLVCGVGGVGSFTIEALVRAGVGSLTLLDFDTVECTNLNRQIIALESTLGQYKADVMAARIKDINPSCTVRVKKIFYSADTEQETFDAPYDYVVDAIDTVGPKIALICTCLERQVPCISALGTGNKLDPTRFEIADINQTSVCPLARVVRRELKARGVAHHTVLYSKEQPLAPDYEERPEGRKVPPGSVSFVPPVAGMLLARHVILQIANGGSL